MNRDPLQLWLPATLANDVNAKPAFRKFQQLGRELRRQHNLKHPTVSQTMRSNNP